MVVSENEQNQPGTGVTGDYGLFKNVEKFAKGKQDDGH